MLVIPDSSAIADRTRRLAGPELREEVDALAHGLLASGAKPGDRVLLLGRKSVELAAALLAVPRAGCIVVAPHPGLKPAQLRHVVEDCTPALAVRLPSSAPGEEAGGAERVADYSDLLAAGSGGALPPRPADHEPAMIVYTSGSTGPPKGVVLSHENVRLGAESVASYFALEPDDRVLCLLPFSFDAGFNQLASAVVAGCEAHLQDFTLAQLTVEACAREAITTLTGVPALWRRLAAADWPPAARRAMRRWASTGGHVPVDLSKHLRELFPDAAPILMYGFTEAFRATYLPPPLYGDKPTSSGVPIPHAAVAVVAADGTLCGPDEVGELVQLGPLVTLGYWNRREETRRKFAPLAQVTRAQLLSPANRLYSVPPAYLDRVAWSGDDVMVDADGCLFFRGRRTALIKSQGFRVSPTEVEHACLATGLVREVVAFGVEQDGEEVIAVVARPASEEVTERDLRRRLTAALPSYQVPHVISLMESLPTTSNGKYDVVALKDELRPGVAARA